MLHFTPDTQGISGAEAMQLQKTNNRRMCMHACWKARCHHKPRQHPPLTAPQTPSVSRTTQSAVAAGEAAPPCRWTAAAREISLQR